MRCYQICIFFFPSAILSLPVSWSVSLFFSQSLRLSAFRHYLPLSQNSVFPLSRSLRFVYNLLSDPLYLSVTFTFSSPSLRMAVISLSFSPSLLFLNVSIFYPQPLTSSLLSSPSIQWFTLFLVSPPNSLYQFKIFFFQLSILLHPFTSLSSSLIFSLLVYLYPPLSLSLSVTLSLLPSLTPPSITAES